VNVAELRLHAQGIAHPHVQSPEAIVTHLSAVQSQDYPGALWSIALRMPIATRVDVERAIADRTIVRTWPMRGTLHFVPAIDARWMLELMTPRIMKSAAGRHRQLELDDGTFRRSRRVIAKALKQTPVLSRSYSTNGSQPRARSTSSRRCKRSPSGISRVTARRRCAISPCWTGGYAARGVALPRRAPSPWRALRSAGSRRRTRRRSRSRSSVTRATSACRCR